MKKLGAIAMMLAAATCGGGKGGGIGGTNPLTQDQADQICEDVCAKQVECGEQPDVATCLPSCGENFVGWARADAVQQLATCFIAQPCGANDDVCFAVVQPLAIHEEWEAGCLSKLAACIDPAQLEAACSVDAGVEDESGLFRFIAPAIMEQIIACLAGPDCTARLDCIENVLDINGVNF